MLELIQLIIAALLTICAIAMVIASAIAGNVPAVIIGLGGVAFSSIALPVAWCDFKKVMEK